MCLTVKKEKIIKDNVMKTVSYQDPKERDTHDCRRNVGIDFPQSQGPESIGSQGDGNL